MNGQINNNMVDAKGATIRDITGHEISFEKNTQIENYVDTIVVRKKNVVGGPVAEYVFQKRNVVYLKVDF